MGTHTVNLAYDDALGCSVSASIEVEVAEAVDATIDEIPDLCESASTLVFSAEDAGGTWTADCGGCMTPAGSFDPGIGPGNNPPGHGPQVRRGDRCARRGHAPEQLAPPQQSARHDAQDGLLLLPLLHCYLIFFCKIKVVLANSSIYFFTNCVPFEATQLGQC